MLSGLGCRNGRGFGVVANTGLRSGGGGFTVAGCAMITVLPMRPGLPFQVAPIELMQPLKRDGATFLGAESCGDFLPSPALLALFADEVPERFKPAAIGPSAAPPFIFGIRIDSPAV